MKTITLLSLLCVCALLVVDVNAYFSQQAADLAKLAKARSSAHRRVRSGLTVMDDDNNFCPGTACASDDDCGDILYPNGTSVDGECKNNMCQAYPIGTAALNAACSRDEDCDSGLCFQDKCIQTIGQGCSCVDDEQCDDYLTCINQVCTPKSQNGGACVENDQCQGTCSNGVCVQVAVGSDCETSQGCVSGAFCDNTGACALIQNNTCGTGNVNGYCAPFTTGGDEGMCTYANDNETATDGQCIYFLGKTAGQSCLAGYFECEIGLACINSVCKTVADGSACASDDNCETFTQQCVCYNGAANATCRSLYPDVSNSPCSANFQKAIDCQTDCGNTSLAFEYNYPCIQACQQTILNEGCCLLCKTSIPIPAFYNVNGSCAAGTAKPINCCSSTAYCASQTKSQLCSASTSGPTTGSSTSTATVVASSLFIVFALVLLVVM